MATINILSHKGIQMALESMNRKCVDSLTTKTSKGILTLTREQIEKRLQVPNTDVLIENLYSEIESHILYLYSRW